MRDFFPNQYLYHRFSEFKDSYAIVYFNDKDDSVRILKYDQLLRAVHLLTKNIGLPKNSVVGVALKDYPDYVIALLAIWKSGCIYMPLDPTDAKGAKERLKLAKASALITNADKFSESYFKDVEGLNYLKWTKISQDIFSGDIDSKNNLYRELKYSEFSDQQSAYIYSSSGTSGSPKMILNTFEGLPGRVSATAKLLDIEPGSGVLGYCSLEFDASLLDILMALSSGACLYAITRRMQQEIALLEKVFKIAAEQYVPITSMVVLPKTLEGLKTLCPELKPFQTLKTMITMGEECGIQCLKYWFEKIEHLKIYNGYGPTETTIAATVTELQREAFLRYGTPDFKQEIENILPMHHTLEGVELFYLDESEDKPRLFDQIQIKTINESKDFQLVIGGLGVGRYLGQNHEIKNVENFICENQSGLVQRYYKSGDRVQVSVHSSRVDLKFICRIDHAVKKNGVFTNLKSVQEMMVSMVGDLASKIQVVSVNGNNFSAFITPSNRNIDENKFETEFFKKLTATKSLQYASRTLPAYFFLMPPAPIIIDKVKSSQNFKDLLKEAKHWMIQCNQEEKLNAIEKEISQIWLSMMYKDVNQISEFKQLAERSGIVEKLFGPDSDFLYNGGDSSSITIMLYQVWRTIKNDSKAKPPASFINSAIMDPTIKNIAELIKIFLSVNFKTNARIEYPLIHLHSKQNSVDWLTKFPHHAICEIELEEKDLTINSDKMVLAIEDKIRTLYPAGGPYILVATKPYQNLVDGLFTHLSKSDLVYNYITKSSFDFNEIERKYEHLIIRSCKNKLKKWNAKPQTDLFEEKPLFPQVPNRDIWYQTAPHSGKTTFLKAWCEYLFNKSSIWPIYFNVDGYFEKDILTRLFNKIGFNNLEKNYLKSQKIFIIIDHYDRMDRDDRLDLRVNSEFKDWDNAIFYTNSRYMQFEKLDSQRIITDEKPNQLLSNQIQAVLLNKKTVNEALQEYIDIEKKYHVRLKNMNIKVKDFLHYSQYYFNLPDLNKAMSEVSILETYQPGMALTRLNRLHPYFIILRGLISYKAESNQFYFNPQLLKLLFLKKPIMPVPELSIGKKLLENPQVIQEYKTLTLEELKTQYSKSRFPESLYDQRKPIIAFFPLTGEVPEHYYKLFHKIGNFQPWIAFAMDVHEFSEIEDSLIMESMANFYVEILQRLPKYMQPYILLGWSFGALLAFKVAEKLEKLSLKVDLVINIDCPPPSYLTSISAVDRAKSIICSLAEHSGYHLDLNTQQMIKQVTEEKISDSKELFVKIKSLVSKLEEYSAFSNMLTRAEINLLAYYNFTPGKISAKFLVAKALKSTTNLNDTDKYKEWENHTSNQFQLRDFDHDHFNIFDSNSLAGWIRTEVKALQLPSKINSFEQSLENFYKSMGEGPEFFMKLDGEICKEGSKRQPLIQLCKNFIYNNQETSLLIYGPSGSGKTTLLRQLAKNILSKDNLSEYKHVIYVRVNNNPQCVKEELMRADFSVPEYQAWKLLPTLIILDGIESLSSKVNLWEANKLGQWQKVKLILSYRYEDSVKSSDIIRGYVPESKITPNSIYCLPLTEVQKHEFLNQTSPDILNKFSELKIHGYVDEVIYNPLILSMLTKLIENRDIKEITNDSRYDFYRYFFQQQIVRAESKIDAETGLISGSNIKNSSFNYMLVLAEKLLNNMSTQELINFDCPAFIQARTASNFILKNYNDKTHFIHDTYLEFFQSIILWKITEHSHFKLLYNHAWHQQPLFKNFSLFNFILDQFNRLSVSAKESKYTYLLECLRVTEVGPYFSSNIMSFLVMTGRAFNNIKFDNISLKQANLNNAIFYNSKFHKVDFSGAVIHNSAVIKCEFDQVNLTNIQTSSDFRIPIENCFSICVSSQNSKRMAFLSRQFYDSKENYFTKQLVGVYDLEQNKIIWKKYISKTNRNFDSIDFDENNNLVITCEYNIFVLSEVIWKFFDYINYKINQKELEDCKSLIFENYQFRLFNPIYLGKLLALLNQVIELRQSHSLVDKGGDPMIKYIHASIKINVLVDSMCSSVDINNMIEIINELSEIISKDFFKKLIEEFRILLLAFKNSMRKFALYKIIEEKLSISIEKIKYDFNIDNKHSFSKSSLSGKARYLLGGEGAFNYQNTKFYKFKELKQYSSDGFYTTIPGKGILINKKDNPAAYFSNNISSMSENSPRAYTINETGKFIAVSWQSDQFSVTVYHVKTMEPISLFTLTTKNKDFSQIIGLAFNPQASFLAVASRNNKITIFDMNTKKINMMLYSRNKLQGVDTHSDKIICFADQYTLLTLTDEGISVWNLEKHINNHLFDYASPRFFSALTFSNLEDKSDINPKLYVGDDCGNISQLDLKLGTVIRTFQHFTNRVIHKIAISNENALLAVVAYHRVNQEKSLYILSDQYNKIAYEGALSILPDAIYFDKANNLALSLTYKNYLYKLTSDGDEFELTKISSNKLIPLLPQLEFKFDPEILKILYNPLDYIFSNNYLIILGMSFDLICCKVIDNVTQILWKKGVIGNNFYKSTFANIAGFDNKISHVLKKSGAEFQGVENKLQAQQGIPGSQVSRFLLQQFFTEKNSVRNKFQARYFNPEVGSWLRFMKHSNNESLKDLYSSLHINKEYICRN